MVLYPGSWDSSCVRFGFALNCMVRIVPIAAAPSDVDRATAGDNGESCRSRGLEVHLAAHAAHLGLAGELTSAMT